MKKIVLLLIFAAVVGWALYMAFGKDTYRTSMSAATEFEIEDTSRVGKIVIADRAGRVISIARSEEGPWMLNDEYPARQDAVDVILGTFVNIYVQRPVDKAAQENVNRVMAAGSKKVDIYDRKGKLIKTWYVGHATMDNKGTYMLLETPRGGRAKEPYIMDMKGFIGILNTRFFTDLNEWRSVVIARYPDLNINEIEVEYPAAPDSSFRIAYGGGNDISLYPFGSNQSVSRFDTSIVKDYMLNFKSMSFENYRSGLSPAQEDSVRATVPYQIIHITDPQRAYTIRLWPMADVHTPEDAREFHPDPERVYAAVDDGEMALAQRYVWDKFRAPIQVFDPQ